LRFTPGAGLSATDKDKDKAAVDKAAVAVAPRVRGGDGQAGRGQPLHEAEPRESHGPVADLEHGQAASEQATVPHRRLHHPCRRIAPGNHAK
jgi:hypothetical protein